MLSWRTTISRHLSIDLLGLRVCSCIRTTYIWIILFLIAYIRLCIATRSCSLHYYFRILSICTCLWHCFSVWHLKYSIISVVINGIHILQLQPLLISEIRLVPLFLTSLSCVNTTHLGSISNIRLSSASSAIADISKPCPLISVVALGDAGFFGIMEIRQSWHIGCKSIFT